MQSETIPPPETFVTTSAHVACDGPGGASGHPRVWLQIGSVGFADCGYCDRRYVLSGGAADDAMSDKSAVADQDSLAPAGLRGEGVV